MAKPRARPRTEPSPFVRRLPIGERLGIDPLADNELFPLEGTITTRPIEPPRIPEPARAGEPGGAPCPACTADGESVIWEDDQWWLIADREPAGLPMVAVLLSKAHHDLEDLPLELAAELGPMTQRVARAIGTLEGIGRVHVNRWGDGSLHFHVWFLARPYGMWQMRGAMLAVWDDLLPRVPQEEWDANRRTVATALAAGGGTARI
jgi:diadenosine tetraphosphate (Ap4A) HIT family hydrolase